jgi:hypothetical protein
MHFVMSYDLGASGERRQVVEEKISTILKPYRWAKRLTTFYIIEVQSTYEWQNILKQMQTLSNSIPESLLFIMSPPMKGGKYDGILKDGEWDFINKLTN